MEDRSIQQLKVYAALAFRLIIGGLFVYASIHKIMDPGSFAESVRNYMILPPSWSNLVALTLPWIELGVGAFLILGIQTRPSALITTFLLGVFLCTVVYAFSIGLDVDCGCFSSGQSSEGRIGFYHLVRDTALFLISLCILFLDKGHFSITRLSPVRRLCLPDAQRS
ncbi:MauE/DoxX family redox-associated membrane protein [Thermodesulfobacteriota bacterium]